MTDARPIKWHWVVVFAVAFGLLSWAGFEMWYQFIAWVVSRECG